MNEFLWETTTSAAFLERLFDAHEADVIVATHTGLHWHREGTPFHWSVFAALACTAILGTTTYGMIMGVGPAKQGHSTGRVQEMVSGRGAERAASEPPPIDTAADVTGAEANSKSFFDDLLSGPQRRLESLQRSIDERIKSSVGRITGHPAFQNEVRRIERSIKNLEERLARLRRREESSSTPPDETP